MPDREKLIDLLLCVPFAEVIFGKREGKRYTTAWRIADHLIANGVTVRERGRWIMKETMIRSPFAKNAYCSECLEETGYAHNFCPNCGADMR